MPQNNLPKKNGKIKKISSVDILERLIHILALKPLKKPELNLRLETEGLLQKDRGSVFTKLRVIANLKDNCYHIKTGLWKEVNDNWPYYTEQEKEEVKRRRPKDLTPLKSISAQKSSSTLLSIKRPHSSLDMADDIRVLQNKKTRISTFIK